MVSKKKRNGIKTKKIRHRGGGTVPGKIYVFYHIYCNKNTYAIVKDQCLRIIFSILYSRVDAIYCFLVGEQDIITEVETLLGNLGKKFTIAAKGPGDTTYERFTLLKIPDYIKAEDKFLYIHSKGVKHSDDKQWIENIYWWRAWMEYFLMTKHTQCLEKLNEYDIVGVNYSTRIIGKHFSGNFWWSTGKYYLSLPKIISDTGANAYHNPERYIFSNSGVKFHDIDGGCIPENIGLYRQTFYPKEYVD